ncbi:nucleotide exchange factor Sil1 [Bradysia coprophila]|uniref:nucleotide exchange factor Sil1 n=1 Tax=Bradysia coprophila TaxID=38358 RepID=UPI00187D7A98|nr:nucleotide exchange factor Sil1 [Bradysia coprophila]
MKLEILLLLTVTSITTTETGKDKKVFVPTNEWKVIDEGQSIPAGLHVRINLQTGRKEAKLLDAEDRSEEKNSALMMSAVSHDDTERPNDDPTSTHSRLKDALKNIPDEGFEYSEEKLKEITKKFRTYENIKEEFEEMNMKIKSDFQLMSDLLVKYQSIEDKLDLNEYRALFEDLDYLLHQIDNANDFVTAGGLDTIILPNLSNQTVPELRIHSVKLLGILVQNNPKGQIAAFEKNVGSILFQMLAQSANISTSELSSLMFAIGGLLRKFPLAQAELLSSPGLKILVDLLGKPIDYKIKMKCLLLLADLIREYDEIAGNVGASKTKVNQATDIKSRLVTTEYCTIMIDLMLIHRQDYLESLYIADDMLNVLILSKEVCEPHWSGSSIFRHTLLAIKTNFEQQKNGTDFDNFELNGIVEKLDRLQTFWSDHGAINDEL